ncbi:MAG: Flp family type IVb pilin [bacterium]|nr:Flp family type IVb pilin [bacterium]
MLEILKKFVQDEEGQGMVEYGLIIGLVAVIVVVVFIALGPKIQTMFEDTIDDDLTHGQNKLGKNW